MSSTRVYREQAPAKINLGLFVGSTRASDGRHELATVMQSISLADELTLEPAPAGSERDELLCPGVQGPPERNLAAVALRMFREASGWAAPAQRLSIVKRIPVAAGLGGGSADAAATLRLAARASGLGDAPSSEGEHLLDALARELGADVPAQVAPGRWLASGAGEQLRQLPEPSAPFGVLVLPADAELSTAAVYGELDRLCAQAAAAGELRGPGAGRGAGEVTSIQQQLAAAFADGLPLPRETELLHNDLQRAAISLCPPIEPALEEARAAGARVALVSGSGPTVLGLFDQPGDAQVAAARLSRRDPAPIVAQSWTANDARVRHNSP